MAKKAKVKADSTEQDLAPTQIEYSGLQHAFDFFNAELFDGQLPNYLIVLSRNANSGGHFAADRYSGRTSDQRIHELSLNPDGFTGRTDELILSILTHEMTHGWQQAYGSPGRRGYHNKQWAAKMKMIGLYPSSSGMVGGKETGQHMAHYIIPNGPFARAYGKLAKTGFKLNWQSAVRSNGKTTPNSKTKFVCMPCNQNAWGKPDLQIRCNLCDQIMLPADNGMDRTSERDEHMTANARSACG